MHIHKEHWVWGWKIPSFMQKSVIKHLNWSERSLLVPLHLHFYFYCIWYFIKRLNYLVRNKKIILLRKDIDYQLLHFMDEKTGSEKSLNGNVPSLKSCLPMPNVQYFAIYYHNVNYTRSSLNVESFSLNGETQAFSKSATLHYSKLLNNMTPDLQWKLGTQPSNLHQWHTQNFS